MNIFEVIGFQRVYNELYFVIYRHTGHTSKPRPTLIVVCVYVFR